MKYNYTAIKNEVEHFLNSNSNEYFYANDISRALGYSAYVIDKVLKNIDTNQLMSYTGEQLIYVHKNFSDEKQIPESFKQRFLDNGWELGRCEMSKRAICIAGGGNPDAIKTMFVHKDTVSIEIPVTELEQYISRGWLNGKFNIGTTGKIAVHKDGEDRYIQPEEANTYIAQGWLIGGKQKRELRDYSNVWNKGKTKQEDPRLQVLSEKIKEINSHMPQEQRDKTSKTVKKLWQDDAYREKQQIKRIGRTPWNKDKRYKLSPQAKEQFLDRSNETKRKRNSFNTSKPEEDYYKYLLTIYGEDDIIRQYRDKTRYPFHCDFYIISEDKFIECNYHWTHNSHPFNPDCEQDVQEAQKLKELSHKSRFYDIAYNVWTDLDVRKRNCALSNKLNYEVVYGGMIWNSKEQTQQILQE